MDGPHTLQNPRAPWSFLHTTVKCQWLYVKVPALLRTFLTLRPTSQFPSHSGTQRATQFTQWAGKPPWPMSPVCITSRSPPLPLQTRKGGHSSSRAWLRPQLGGREKARAWGSLCMGGAFSHHSSLCSGLPLLSPLNLTNYFHFSNPPPWWSSLSGYSYCKQGIARSLLVTPHWSEPTREGAEPQLALSPEETKPRPRSRACHPSPRRQAR